MTDPTPPDPSPPGGDAPETAMVVVRPPGYRDLEPITSANVHRHLPSDEQVRIVQQAFAEAGFEVSTAHAGAFAITGPPSRFRELLPPLPATECLGVLAPVSDLVHLVTTGFAVEPDTGTATGPGPDDRPELDP